MAAITSLYALFNNYNLNTVPNGQVYSIDVYKGGIRGLNIFQIARRSARKVTSAFYKADSISLGYYISAPTKASMEQSMDTLLANIQAIEGQLVVPQSGTVRGYTATYSAMRINQQKGGFLDLTLTFEFSDSFGYDTNYTVIQPATNFTASLVQMQYTQGGGADTQTPFIQAKVTAVTGGTSASVTIGNQGSGQAIVITRTWAVNDLIQVDVKNQSVQVNGVDVVFTGAFPEVGLGLQTLYYQDTFTTRTVQLFAYVYNRYN